MDVSLTIDGGHRSTLMQVSMNSEIRSKLNLFYSMKKLKDFVHFKLILQVHDGSFAKADAVYV